MKMFHWFFSVNLNNVEYKTNILYKELALVN